MNKSMLVSMVLAVLVASCVADIYVHSPRGSNNKLNEENQNAQNQNRLFDSQNNAKGGYQWGDTMTFYEGSLLQVEWTAQHGCGSDNLNTDCNFVLQYMCGPWIRDGTEQGTPNTIGQNNGNNLVTYNAEDNLLTGERGQQEPLSWYNACQLRNRNKGLFAADQNINTNSAEGTRQNPNGNSGNRHGFECPEERDYYPYWAPTPWKDIAVLSSETGRCDYYRKESQNVKNKGLCIVANAATPEMDWDKTLNIPDIWANQASDWEEQSCIKNGNKWVEVKKWGISAPDCFAPAESRDNHLGNVYIAGNIMTQHYKWVIPNVDFDKDQKYATCAFRLRYNISSGDYNGFAHVDKRKGKMIDASYNGKDKSPVTNDPNVNYGLDEVGRLRNLTLNINTNQFGRTFSDRSHAFKVVKRPGNVEAGARIFNLGVRGRRGNIVQCYPGVEYDFSPNSLEVTRADYIHFQWTGSNHNAANQAGNGLDKYDRSNLVPITGARGPKARANYPDKIENVKLFSSKFAYKLAHLDQPAICDTPGQTDCCKPDPPAAGNHNNNEQDTQNCNYLNMATPLFNGGAVRPKSTGTYYFMSTRSNNFTNRSQKMTIKVTELLSPVALTGIAIGGAGFIGAAVVGGGVWYAQSHASSGAANVFGSIKI